LVLKIGNFRANSFENQDDWIVRLNLDLAALRSLVTGTELGSFVRAADRVGRSTSAVSAQLHKLEDAAGVPLFRKSGRTLALTEAGELMLSYARRMVALNDEAIAAVRGVDLAGGVRLGLQEEFGEAILPDVLGQFARAHPKVRVEAVVARNRNLLERIEAHTLDLALVWGDCAQGRLSWNTEATVVDEPSLSWIGSATVPWQGEPGEPVPLAVFEGPCLFHSAATAALDRAGISWRVSFTSPNLGGLWAAAAAGLGLVVRTAYGLPASVRPIEASAGLPALGTIPLVLLRAPGQMSPVAERLLGIIRGVLGAEYKPSAGIRRAVDVASPG
jgi:DNA-binding transcriptional LysR family regulator